MKISKICCLFDIVTGIYTPVIHPRAKSYELVTLLHNLEHLDVLRKEVICCLVE